MTKARTRDIWLALLDDFRSNRFPVAACCHPTLQLYAINSVFGNSGRRQIRMVRTCKKIIIIDLRLNAASEKIYVKRNFQSALNRSNRNDRWA